MKEREKWVLKFRIWIRSAIVGPLGCDHGFVSRFLVALCLCLCNL